MDARYRACYLNAVTRVYRHVGLDTILDAAEDHFRERGYNGVTLADIARASDIRKPSLYYHFPDGKEQLFVAVQSRMFARISGELAEVLTQTPGDLHAKFLAAADWFFARPPMFILAMMHHDMPALSEEHREQLSRASYGAIVGPLVDATERAARRGEIRDLNPHTIAGGFLALLESNTIAHRAGFGGDLPSMMRNSLDMIFRGIVVEPA